MTAASPTTGSEGCCEHAPAVRTVSLYSSAMSAISSGVNSSGSKNTPTTQVTPSMQTGMVCSQSVNSAQAKGSGYPSYGGSQISSSSPFSAAGLTSSDAGAAAMVAKEVSIPTMAKTVKTFLWCISKLLFLYWTDGVSA